MRIINKNCSIQSGQKNNSKTKLFWDFFSDNLIFSFPVSDFSFNANQLYPPLAAASHCCNVAVRGKRSIPVDLSYGPLAPPFKKSGIISIPQLLSRNESQLDPVGAINFN